MTMDPALMTLLMQRRGPNKALIPPIGVAPLVLWDARFGVTLTVGAVSKWTDIMRGLPLTDAGTTTRPLYGPDYNYFGGANVVQFDGVNDVLRNTAISPAVTAAGTRPHWFVVFRFRGASGCLFIAVDSPVTNAMPSMIRTATGVLQSDAGGNVITGADTFGAQHVGECFMSTAAGVLTLGSDGIDVTSGTGRTMPNAVAKLYVGTYDSLSFPAAASIAAIGCYAAELTAQQRIDLRAYYAAVFPAPPLTPPDFLSNLLVWVDPAYCSISLGKIANFTNRGNVGGVLTQGTAGSRATLNATDASFANKPSLNADGSSYPLPVPGSYPGMECFVVGVHATDPTTLPGGGAFQRQGSAGAGAGNGGFLPLYGAAREVYGEFASTARKGPLGPFAVNFALPWLIDMWSAPSDWGLRHNRVNLYTTATNGVGATAVGTILSDNREGAYYFVGKWAAYFLCGAKQSAAQRAQMEAWVLATYGV